MDPWVSAALASRVALCVTNRVTRDAAVSAAAIVSIDQIIEGRAVLGIGAGHSGTKNLGRSKSTAKELGEGVVRVLPLSRRTAGRTRDAQWIRRRICRKQRGRKEAKAVKE
jgi:alkanesulfonate monooxygenase SsuD/methylene tetrahydromethanopterin reductase-like flavin-dependent oxidoreductase (luciferase family)